MDELKSAFIAGKMYQAAMEYIDRYNYLPIDHDDQVDLLRLIENSLGLAIHYADKAGIAYQIDEGHNLTDLYNKYIAILQELPTQDF